MRFFYPLVNVGNRWQPAGSGGWEGQGGENLASLAALDGAPVYLYVWDADAATWSGGPFDAGAAAMARPKFVVQAVPTSGGGTGDAANVDSLLWNARKDAITALAAGQGLVLYGYPPDTAGLSPSRNVYQMPDVNNWLVYARTYA